MSKLQHSSIENEGRADLHEITMINMHSKENMKYMTQKKTTE